MAEDNPASGSTMNMECGNPVCKQTFAIKLPPAAIINHPLVSQVVVVHPEPEYCPFCNQAYAYKLVQVGQIQTAWVPIQSPKAPIIIAPPPGLKIV